MKFGQVDGSVIFMNGVAEHFGACESIIVETNVRQLRIVSDGAGNLPSDAEVCW